MRPVVLGVLLLALAAPAAARAADTPTARTLYEDGAAGRYLMEGDWLFRLDAADRGVRRRFYRQTRTAGWSTVQVPHAWNVGDHSVASMNGSVGWYRKDFELPDASAALDWAVRFESVNYRARVWLNGREVGSHAGAYLPFTVPLQRLRRVNRLVVRVDSRRTATDLPPGRISPRTRLPTGGWWNYGGILREVYLQKIDTLAIESARVNPRLRCATCPATAVFEGRLRNVTSGRRRAVVTGTFGSQEVRLGAMTLRPGAVAGFRGSLRVAAPAPVVAARPVSLPGGDRGPRRRAARRPLDRAHGRAVGPRGRRPADPQRPARAAARGRPARGQRSAGLRGRQRVATRAARPGEGARRDDAPHALPAAPVHPRGGRPRGAADLVRDPRLLAQELADRRHHAARGGRAAHEHRDQRQPSVGADLVDRQRAVVEARPDPGHLYPPRRARGPRAGSDAAGRPRRGRLPGRRLPGSLPPARRHRHQRLLRLVPGPAGRAVRPRPPLAVPGLAPAAAIRTTR